MSTQLSFADQAAREARRKTRGMARAAASVAPLLEAARRVATAIAERDGTADVDRVRAEMERRGLEIRPGNWMGSIFMTAGWARVGDTKSTHDRGHRRRISVWRLR